MKVKIIYSSHPMNLESEINHWLTFNNYEVIDIKYAAGDYNSGMFKFTAMVIYKE